MNDTSSRKANAKLILNNMYGKDAVSDDSSSKSGIIDVDNLLKFICIDYYGENKRNFIYADTDSIYEMR